jgi:oxalate decarboxylase/phosphoglucose isomerase-like protein (cupin superfamily)
MPHLLECNKIEIPKIPDPRGNLSFFENESQIPFIIRRTYLIYDVPGGEIRGGHAFRQQHEFIVALSGSFDVVVKDASGDARVFQLNRSYNGLYVPNMLWRHMENFSTNAVCLVVTSTDFNPDDYIRDFQEFENLSVA